MTSQITAYRNGEVHEELLPGSEVVDRCMTLIGEGYTLWKVGEPDISHRDTLTPSFTCTKGSPACRGCIAEGGCLLAAEHADTQAARRSS